MSKKTQAAAGVADASTAPIEATFAKIQLSDLHIDPLNVRKNGTEEDPIITASIQAIGLQQPLIVRKDGNGYGVIAGGKRLLSLQKLFPDTVSVACMIVPEGSVDVALTEASLAENVARSDMHQVDEYRTFARLANDKDNPHTPEQIAKRFGITLRQVQQRLALGNLHPDVLEAFADDRLTVEAVRAFTLIPSQKIQKEILGKIEAGKLHPSSYYIRQAAGADDQNVGKLVILIGEAAYAARGGTVTHDLFGDNHVVSDPKLIRKMVDELLDAKCKELVEAGWKTAVSVRPDNWYSYEGVNLKFEPTAAEKKDLKRLEAIIEANEQAEEEPTEAQEREAEAASEAYDNLKKAIEQRAITPAIKAKAVVHVHVNHDGTGLELEYRYPPRAAPKTPEATKKAAAKKKLPPAENISQALLSRLGMTLTTAAQAAIEHQPNVALASLLASLASRSHAVGIHPTARVDFMKDKPKSLPALLPGLLKLPVPELVKLLTIEVARSLSLSNWGGAPLEEEDNMAVATAIDTKRLLAALREKFDAKAYFDAVPRTVIVDAVDEAMGGDHARHVGKMDKAGAVKFAAANIPKTKWLPVQLRVKGYDGPARKAAVKKTAAKKKAKR